jgi:hypothetical protein
MTELAVGQLMASRALFGLLNGCSWATCTGPGPHELKWAEVNRLVGLGGSLLLYQWQRRDDRSRKTSVGLSSNPSIKTSHIPSVVATYP